MGATFQIFLIGVPTVVAVYSTSSFARFICISLIVFVTNIAMIGFIFVPKIFHAYAIFQTTKNSANSPAGSQHSSRSGKGRAPAAPANASAVASGSLM